MGTRLTTQETVLAAATRLFLERGLAAVSMEELAAEAGCTRRNLYRYYSTKEDLAFDVLIALLGEWNRVQCALFDGLSGSALVRLRSFLDGLVDHLSGQRAFLRLAGEFDFTFQDRTTYQPDADRSGRFQAVLHTTEELLERLLALGSDGSLRLPAPVPILVPTLTTVLWSLAQRVALRERLTAEEFGVSGLELVRTHVDLIVLALTPFPQGEPHERV